MTCSFNNRLLRPLLPLFLLLITAAVISTVNADALVTGAVFCDQCKDGYTSFFDYPLYGASVAVECGGGDYREERTNFLGSYSIRFEGSPDLTGCFARLVRGTDECGPAVGPAQGLRFFFRMFGMEAYTVDPLLAQPSEPMSFCPSSAPPVISVPPPAALTRPPVVSPSPPVILVPPPAALTRPPVVSPPPPLPELPFFTASACSYDKWLMPQFKCYWRVVAPETPVAVAFGPVAAGKYGPDKTLWDGLHGRGDVYLTLLREATAALLNSYNSFSFLFPTVGVVSDMNLALLGSQREALVMAARFRRANSGISGQSLVACNFVPCS